MSGNEYFISVVRQIIEVHVTYTILNLCYYINLMSLAFWWEVSILVLKRDCLHWTAIPESTWMSWSPCILLTVYTNFKRSTIVWHRVGWFGKWEPKHQDFDKDLQVQLSCHVARQLVKELSLKSNKLQTLPESLLDWNLFDSVIGSTPGVTFLGTVRIGWYVRIMLANVGFLGIEHEWSRFF